MFEAKDEGRPRQSLTQEGRRVYPQQQPPPGQGAFGGVPPTFGAPAMMPSASSYEFSEYENVVIRELASSASFFGVVAIVLGTLGTLGAVISLANPAGRSVSVVTVVGLLIQGIFARSAAQRFQAVVDTQGNDIPFMVDALGHLKRYYVALVAVSAVSLLSSLFAVVNLLSLPSS